MTPPTKALLARRTALRTRLGLLGPIEALAVRQTGGGMHEDGPSEAAEVTSAVEALASREHTMAELRAVEVALAKVERGEYGVCSECGEAISPARLRVIPWASLCLRDQESIEADMRRLERSRVPSPPGPEEDEA